MRVSESDQKIIHDTLSSLYGNSVDIYLFVSRTNDSKKGVDIDLLLVSPQFCDDEQRRIHALTLLQRSIGLQKIDLICTDNIATNLRIVVQEARRNGLRIRSVE